MSRASSLVSTQNHVEAPFIIVKIGEYTFGHCDKEYKNKLQTQFNITYPNYMESLSIVKVNGAVNTYTLNMVYAITPMDDPNRLEKVFSSISNSRLIYLSYGDWNAPSFVYKEEEAIITKLTTRLNVENSTIQYTIQCTSNALALTSGVLPFPARTDKPSDVLIELLTNKGYGLTNLFKGMEGKDPLLFISGDDQTVELQARTATILEYISYLVSCMVFIGDDSESLKTSCYFWSVFDDTTNQYGGTYFKVVRVAANTNTAMSYNTYEVDIGYPTSNCVTGFSVNNDDSWALLFDYAHTVSLPEYSYHIDDTGHVVQKTSSVVTASRLTHTTNEATRDWWSRVTQFPITATLTMKGLLRPVMLTSYVKVNTLFYGHKHTSSGLYIITKQEDSISKSGYRTTLTLLRVGGDEHYA